jgi:enamine deaminase RidA (YjgF/YER057c/UK114 family)
MTSPYDRLSELGLELPPAPVSAGSYQQSTLHNGVLHLSGHGPIADGKPLYTGQVGSAVSLQDAVLAARLTMLNLLATVHAALGSLDRVEQALRLFGMVSAAPDFGAHPTVINGASELLVAVLGDRGRHSRSAVGLASLPFGMSVEIELTVAVRD